MPVATAGLAADRPPFFAPSARPLSLKLNFSWTLAGNVVQAICRYAMLVLLVYFCGLAAGGRYALATALCTPIWSIVLLGLRAAMVNDARGEYVFADYLAVRVLASALGMLAVAATILASGHGPEMAIMILLVAAAKFFEGLSDIFHGRLQQYERMDRVGIALAFRGVAGIVLMIPAAVLAGTPLAVVAALPVATALTFLFWDVPCAASLDAQTEATVAASLWRYPLQWSVLARLSVAALPIAIAGFLVALVPQLPIYVIGSLLGEESVALYTLIAYWITLGMVVVTALGNTANPRLAKYHAAGQTEAFIRLLVQLVLLVGAMGAAGVAAAIAMPLLAANRLANLGPGMTDLPRVTLALSIFAAMLYLTGPLGRALNAMRRFWTQVAIRSIGIGVALVLLPWMVAARGLPGAADAMAASAAVVTLLFAVVVVKRLTQPASPWAAAAAESNS